ncbi:GNAT family N-acetyltransferase [Coleofasciculus sp. FACHB-64]|uniref:GNAT family N-acetyltransferase n=1 Tax=Cyanophyceae TaxID=3028117 RepID=UPI0016822727|nr:MULTISPECIES: GNAT family protein [unclassified Coleofasciculus]MBD1838254.1 GNAT family N-acetyltransferase [Coleofasciculus sp. FACHB-501]MBD1895326.1 GNAT family N-acetyltransferase [Coleofasciculus sp. FACHB-129]MBD2045569.1 GNAT family N-acetyltransferase [Coleofasciculus sp. FACHB-64]
MLKGERLTLRGIRRDDLPKLCEFNNDLAVELAGGGDPPIPQSLERLQAEFDQNAAKGGRDGTWFAIEADGKFIGQCGLVGFDIFQGVARVCELGIAIGDKEYWGRGYGREAIALLLNYAFRYWNLHRVWLRTNSRNERAIRCYQSCGFVEEGRLRGHEWYDGSYIDTLCMGILREEWEQIKKQD